TGCRRICPTTSLTASPRPDSISAIPIATRAMCPTTSSAGAATAGTMKRPLRCLAHIRPRSACAFTPATRFRLPTATRSSSLPTARHGWWNKANRPGGDVIVVRLNPNGSVKSWGPVMTGFLQDNNYIGRPVDVAVLKDGSLLVSDDYAGAIYRISYNGRRVAER